MLGMSQANYSDLENGKTKISNDVAQLLADVFAVRSVVFTVNKPMVNNHNIGTYSKGIIQTETYNESEKETILVLLQKIDSLFIQLQQERDAVNEERKQLILLMSKLIK